MRVSTLFAYLLIIIPFLGIAQSDSLSYYLSNQPRFLNQYQDTLPNAFTGGFKNPQVNNLDLNQDGKLDIVVFDGRDSRVLPFLKRNNGKQGGTQWVYAPKYEEQLPQGTQYTGMLTRDYNKDGKLDLFYVTTTADLAYYKNVSDSSLQFELMTDEVQAKKPSTQDTFTSRIYVGRTDIPGIADVDMDGDLDILAFNIGGGYLNYFRNYADEVPNSDPDSFYMILEDRCWGCFNESGGSSNLPGLNINCNDYPRIGKQHAGSNILPLNLDADGDMDLLYGDVGYDNLVAMTNSKEEFNHPIDSFTEAVDKYPKNDKSAVIPEFLAPFKAYINGDSVYDLVVTPQAEIAGKSKNQLWYYENKGTEADPEFSFVKKDFIQESMLDLGDHSAPVFFDYNGDGVQDLLIATKGDYEKTNGNQDRLLVYENKGTNEDPIYEKAFDDYLSLRSQNWIDLKPATGDLDGDGDQDLVLGNSEGQLIYFENNAGPGEKASFSKKTNFLDSIDVGRSSAPAIGDIDNDGQNDLLIGTEFRKLFYYQFKGMKGGNPNFKKITDNFGKVKADRYSFLTPRLADLDQNDSTDLILGTQFEGHLKFYPNFQKYQGDTFKSDNKRIRLDTGEQAKARFLGHNLTPAINNQNADSIPDVMIGNARGGLVFLSSQFNQDTISSPGLGINDPTGNQLSVGYFPNPADQEVQIKLDLKKAFNGELQLSLINQVGQKVLDKPLKSRTQTKTIGVDHLQNGTYIAVIREAQTGQVLARDKILIVD